MRNDDGEVLEFLMASTACIGILHGIGLPIPWLDRILIIAALICTALLLILNIRNPRRFLKMLIVAPLLGLAGYLLTYELLHWFINSATQHPIKIGP